MRQIITEFLKTEPYYISAMSNISAVIMDQMPDLNWAGFYLERNGQLVVGPFQGKPACIHIARGRGVCGTCLDRDETIVVPDVHKFPGHIACDSASNSEIVIPIHRDGEVADYTVTDDGITVILKGSFDEMWASKLDKVMETYTRPDGFEALK